MTWADDAHGILLSIGEAKLYRNGGHTWAMKLSQLHRQKGICRIVTYSLPDIQYVHRQLDRRPHGVFIVFHEKFLRRGRELKNEFPLVRFACCNNVHSKVCMIEPNTVYVSSANFGYSGWHETTIGIRSKKAHDWYLQNSFLPLWNESKELYD